MKFFENSIRYYVAITIMILVSLLATVFRENESEKIFLFGLSFLSLYYLYIIFTSENVDWGKGIDWNTPIINILWGISIILWALFTQFIMYIIK